jgi:hypothetical protein
VDQTTVFWIAGAVAAFVFVDVLIVELRRCLREGRRIADRLVAYADLPIFSVVAGVPHEAERLVRAFESIAPLIVRGKTALVALGIARERDATG